MKNQERYRATKDVTSGILDQRIRKNKNREKALYDFSNIPGIQTKRMTQNNLKKK